MHLRLADPNNETERSPLAESLAQIAEKETPTEQASPPAGDNDAESVDSPCLINWQERFNQNRKEITRRLQMIEAELDRLDESKPSLSVFDGHK